MLFSTGGFRCAEGIPGTILTEFGLSGLRFFLTEDFRCAKGKVYTRAFHGVEPHRGAVF